MLLIAKEYYIHYTQPASDTLAIQAELDMKIAKKFGIIDTTAQPGDKFTVTLLPENKKPSEYTQSDIVEAYSKIALAHYLYNEEYLPITKGGHQLLREIGRVVDVARLYKAIGDAWHTYAKSPEGKAYLANGGASFADLLRTAGFKVGSLVAQAKATAQQQIQTIEASNWQPAIEDELDALLEDIEAEEQLAELNQQQANQPTTIPAEQSITGQEITVEPTSEQETLVSPDDTPESHLRNLIQQGKAKTQDFARFFRDNPSITEAQATELGIRPLTQRGEPTAAYTQGRLLAERCTDAQYLLLKSGKLTQKAKRDILGAPTQTRRNPAWPKRAKKGIAPAEQRLSIIKALQNAVDPAAENPNYNLNFTRHIISKGREYYIATDGRRLAVIERTAPKGSKNIEESLDKNGNVVKDAKFPESWRQVMIALTDKAQTLDLAPFRYLETYPKTAINHVVWQDSQGKLSKYNPNYIGKGIKFFSTLSKAIGSPSTIQVDNQSMGPILMQSDHDVWTAKYLLMPMLLVDGDIYKEGDILLTPQPSASTNFSIKAVQEMQNVHNCVQELSSGEDGTLRNTAWGHDIIVPHGRIGKKGYGVNHMHEKRLLHGFTEDEAAFIIVCAMKAAATDTSPAKQENSLWFERFGIRAVVAQNSPDDARLLTGFIWNTKGGKKAVDSDAANNAQRFYALDELRRVQVVGAALQKAVTQFEQIVNNNPENWEQIITAIVKELQIKQNTKAEGGVYEGSPLDAFSATAAESADLFTDGVLEAQNAIVTKPGANFSIKPAAADTLDRFTADPLGERIIHHIRTEARRYARLLGDKAPYEQAVNAAQSAASIISAVDKYLHTPGKPVPARYRRQLQKLRSIAEKYAQIIASGTPRSFKKISPQEKQELDAAIAGLEAQELEAATTESDQLLTDSDRLTKREATACQKEHHRRQAPQYRRKPRKSRPAGLSAR